MKEITDDEIMFELLTLMTYLHDKEAKQKLVGSTVVNGLWKDYREGKLTALWLFENREVIAETFREEVDACKSDLN